MEGLSTQNSSSETQLRKVTFYLTPEESFILPDSDGYLTYSSLLSVLETVDEDISEQIHGRTFGGIHTSGLFGQFKNVDHNNRKKLLSDETYYLDIGVTDPEDEDIFQAIVNSLVFEDNSVEMWDGTLDVKRFETEKTTRKEILETVKKFDDPEIEMNFKSATCIRWGNNVTAMFPHREAVFLSLLRRWNRGGDVKVQLDLSREDIVNNVFAKPDPREFQTHSVLVDRDEDSEGDTKNMYRQGFVGKCGYGFKSANESIKNAVTALALFAEYSGVGGDVARGCGYTTVDIRSSQ